MSMLEFWHTKEFKTQQQLKDWEYKNKNTYQYNEVFINNGYCIECRKLRRVY